jgi:tetratricopeptide (TPR) repeat protein
MDRGHLVCIVDCGHLARAWHSIGRVVGGKMKLCGIVLLLIVSLFCASPLIAADGELGQINFPTSGSAEAQKHFLKGVLWLHSFEYEDARAEFQQAQKLEPGFAMAYWGEAMTYNHPIWMEIDQDSARAALQRLGASPQERLVKAKTDREKAYLAAVENLYGEGDKKSHDLAYAAAMKNLYEKYPDDLEAASFYSLALLGTCEYERDIPTYMKAAAVAEEVFMKNPRHPGAAHYLIHSYDDPVHAPLGLRAARAYAKIAPAAPHALHMPSHIFLALGMWNDVVNSNVESWKASAEKGYHALQWLEYAYLQLGRYRDAREKLAIMERDTKQNKTDRTRWFLAAMRSSYLIETSDWKDPILAEQADTSDLAISVTAGQYFVNGFAAVKQRDLGSAKKILAKLRQTYDSVQQTSAKEVPSQGHQSMSPTNSPQDFKAAQVIMKELEALILLQEGNSKKALALVKEAADAEDNMSFEFGPPLIVKPTHELYGEMLLQLGQSAEARKQFELALAHAPKRVLSLLGLAQSAEASGDKKAASEAYEELKKIRQNADPGVIAAAVEILDSLSHLITGRCKRGKCALQPPLTPSFKRRGNRYASSSVTT